jgi:hypothetical protein
LVTSPHARCESREGFPRDALTLFWAKLGWEILPEKYHCVLCHLIDVGQVARQLWERALRDKVRGWVTAKLGLADSYAAGSWLAFWAAAHDIGKVSPGFQAQCNSAELLRRLGANWFESLSSTKPHGTLSESAGPQTPLCRALVLFKR